MRRGALLDHALRPRHALAGAGLLRDELLLPAVRTALRHAALLLRVALVALPHRHLLRHRLPLRVARLLHPRLLPHELLLPAVGAVLRHAALLLRVPLLLDELLLAAVRTALRHALLRVALRYPALLHARLLHARLLHARLLLHELLLPAVGAVLRHAALLLRVPLGVLLGVVLLPVRALGLGLFAGVPRLVALGAVAPALISHRSPYSVQGVHRTRVLSARHVVGDATVPQRSQGPSLTAVVHGEADAEAGGEACWAR
nr:hypothetical protein RKE32_04220 [Streptomyces sp. Li-HN-5-13]